MHVVRSCSNVLQNTHRCCWAHLLLGCVGSNTLQALQLQQTAQHPAAEQLYAAQSEYAEDTC
jgi:hypothetical protein